MSILKRTVYEHIRALRSKEYSALELSEAYFREIFDRDSSYCSAFLTVDSAVIQKHAKKADKLLSEGNAPLLCGIPFAAKDNICTKGMRTTAGSRILKDFVPPYDATVIELLKKQGAVLLGKTIMDEFAMGSTSKNSAYGEALNPLNRKMTPGGSSGGSAAAVAAGFSPFALGSDTGGSVRQPAAFCGCVGMSPTYGAVSRYGLIAFASSLDRIGIITKNCADNAAVLSSVCKKDRRDATSRGLSLSPEKCSTDIKGLRIGIADEFFSRGVSESTKAAVMSAAEKYRKAGAELVHISLPSLSCATEAYYIISSAEASSNLARYDGIRFGSRAFGSADSIDGFYKKNRSEGFGDEVKRRIMLGTFVLSEGSYEDYYEKAISVRRLVREDYRKAFEKCDLILSPTAPAAAYPLNEEFPDPTMLYAQDICTVSQSLAGLPALSVPCAKDERGMPIGMQLTGPAFSEGLLYSAGIVFEEVSE